MRTTSYLQRQTEGSITLDLITIASYSVGGTEIVVPQRVDGEAPALDASQPSAKPARKGELNEGAQVFEDSIASAPVEEQARLRELCAWHAVWGAEGVVRLESFRGIANRWGRLLRLAAEDVGFAAVWHEPVPSCSSRARCSSGMRRRSLLRSRWRPVGRSVAVVMPGGMRV